MLRKLLGWVVLLFVLYYAVTNPHTAAGFVHTLAAGIATFAAALAGGGR
jgi:hypothetical protein